jgi:hypothetical protein
MEETIGPGGTKGEGVMAAERSVPFYKHSSENENTSRSWIRRCASAASSGSSKLAEFGAIQVNVHALSQRLCNELCQSDDVRQE